MEKPVGVIASTYAAAVLCLIFVFLNEFKKFKGFGVEAELLENKVKEADHVLTQLRSLLTPISEMLFSVIARQGLWDSRLPKADSFRLINELSDQLRKLGQEESSIDSALREWHEYNKLELTRVVTEKIRVKIHEKFVESKKKIDSFREPIDESDKPQFDLAVERSKYLESEINRINSIANIENKNNCGNEIEGFLSTTRSLDTQEIGKLNYSIAEDLKDLRYYISNHNFRRLSVWVSRT